ncbi:hypothetical protein GQ54DRAFT_1301 [Martensiomyces pterosporus]|nr:hypothetical protein GQ54DRAFT_1301 [Martensiomyces pterosporus]
MFGSTPALLCALIYTRQSCLSLVLTAPKQHPQTPRFLSFSRLLPRQCLLLLLAFSPIQFARRLYCPPTSSSGARTWQQLHIEKPYLHYLCGPFLRKGHRPPPFIPHI